MRPQNKLTSLVHKDGSCNRVAEGYLCSSLKTILEDEAAANKNGEVEEMPWLF
jgi:hypothetical protein